jgi:hypothetical protein
VGVLGNRISLMVESRAFVRVVGRGGSRIKILYKEDRNFHCLLDARDFYNLIAFCGVLDD